MKNRYLDLILLLLLTIFVMVFRLTGLDGGLVLRFAGLVFVLFAPGYAIVAAVFREDSLEFPARLAFSIGISLAISAVGGIALYGIGALLTVTSWTVFLGTIILLGIILSWIQRSRNQALSSDPPVRKLAYSELFLSIVGLIALVSSISIAQVAENIQSKQPFTEFWIESQNEANTEIKIALRNNEQKAMEYNVSVVIDDNETETWENISVPPDQEWQTSYELPTDVPNEKTVIVYLYTTDNPDTPYRWVQLYQD